MAKYMREPTIGLPVLGGRSRDGRRAALRVGCRRVLEDLEACLELPKLDECAARVSE
jgi:hypothetical protein